MPFSADRFAFYLAADGLPAFGRKTYRIAPCKTYDGKAVFWPEPQKSAGLDIGKRAGELEDECLRARVEADGTLTLTDKTNGKVYSRLSYFEDTGDTGDYWIRYSPYGNKTLTGCGSLSVWLEDNGPLSATMGVSYVLRVPAFAHKGDVGPSRNGRRSDEEADISVRMLYTLRRGARRLECELTVDNAARDHRLRLMMDTGLAAVCADAAGHFTVDRRPAVPQRDGDGMYYPEMCTLPMQQFVDVSDDAHGFAVIGDFTEYELLPDGTGTLALTLFRSVRNVICTEFRSASVYSDQDGGQSLGEHKLRFALCPHSGGWRESGLYKEAGSFLTGLALYQTNGHPGTLAPDGGMLSLAPESLVVSALKRAEDRESFIVRLFNPTDEHLSGELRLCAPIREAFMANLNEERISALETDESGTLLRVPVPPGKIITVELIV
jgi:mannosylglycerate hydrolase